MSETGNASDITGKKIFFLYPTAVVQNRIITELAQQEYEVYVSKNKDSLKRVLSKYSDSVVFVDINEQMPEKDWDLWVTSVMEASDTKNVSVGIVTANDDETIKRKYLMSIKVACGYTIIKFDLDKAVSHIMTVLQAVNAKGRRKYIRATVENESNTTVNLPWGGEFVNGMIKDISVVGISCTLDTNPEIPKNTLFKDIQIKLQSSLLKVEGIVFGSRMEGSEKIYVLLFTQRNDPEIKAKIRRYIQQNLQGKIDVELR
jgi:DNA-binding response OmpR family regulator